MLPIVVDGSRLEIALTGRGLELTKRLAWLAEGGSRKLTVYTDEAGIAASLPEGAMLVPRLPTRADIAAVRLLWICGLDVPTAAGLARRARALGTLVNVEDVIPLCDFHTPAIVRRGDLLISVSTAGRSPALAQRLRRWLDERLGPEWAGRLEILAGKRQGWRREKRPLPELAALGSAVIDRQGWLAEGGAHSVPAGR